MLLTDKNSKRIRLSVCIVLAIATVAIVIYSLRDMKYIFEYLKTLEHFDTNPVTFKDVFRVMGLRGVFAYIALQVIFVITVVVPSTPLQMLAGLSYNPIMASGILMIGIGVGSTIMFLASRLIGTEIIELYKKKDKQNKILMETIATVKSDKINVTVFAILLYLLPVLPYGLICIILSTSNIRTWKFTLIATFASFLDVIVNTMLGKQLSSNNHIITFIIFGIFAILITLIFIKAPKIFNWVKAFAVSKK